jgi:hypothetical protein
VQAFKHSAANTSTIDPKESLYDFIVKKVPEVFPTDSQSQRKIILQMSEMWGTFVGSPVERQSLKFFWLEECIDGGMFSSHLISKKLSRSIPGCQAFAKISVYLHDHMYEHVLVTNVQQRIFSVPGLIKIYLN